MKPIDFPEANRTFAKPANMTDEECAPLRVHDTGEALISCWRPGWRDRFRLLLGRPIWLWIIGRAQPPVAIEVEDPFAARRETP